MTQNVRQSAGSKRDRSRQDEDGNHIELSGQELAHSGSEGLIGRDMTCLALSHCHHLVAWLARRCPKEDR